MHKYNMYPCTLLDMFEEDGHDAQDRRQDMWGRHHACINTELKASKSGLILKSVADACPQAVTRSAAYKNWRVMWIRW